MKCRARIHTNLERNKVIAVKCRHHVDESDPVKILNHQTQDTAYELMGKAVSNGIDEGPKRILQTALLQTAKEVPHDVLKAVMTAMPEDRNLRRNLRNHKATMRPYPKAPSSREDIDLDKMENETFLKHKWKVSQEDERGIETRGD